MAEEPEMSSRSDVTGAGGSEARNRCPYPIVRIRGSQDRQHTAVATVTQKPAQSLSQRENGQGDLQLGKPVSTPLGDGLQPGRDHGMPPAMRTAADR